MLDHISSISLRRINEPVNGIIVKGVEFMAKSPWNKNNYQDTLLLMFLAGCVKLAFRSAQLPLRLFRDVACRLPHVGTISRHICRQYCSRV